MIVLVVNRSVSNNTGFCRSVCREFGVEVSQVDVMAHEANLGDIFLVFPEKVNVAVVFLVVRERLCETQVEDLRSCLENLMNLGVVQGLDMGMVAVGCQPEYGGLLGGFMTLVDLVQKVGFDGALYYPRR